MHNLEIKVRCAETDALAMIAERATKLGARFMGTLHQRDTYFAVPHGRLKLREWHDDQGQAAADLIGYLRPNTIGTRTSDFHLTPIPDPSGFVAIMAATVGITVIVEKERRLHLFGATRIHLDQIARLGDFVELETLLPTDPTTAQMTAAHQEHQALIAGLGLATLTIIGGSYSDLLLSTSE